MEEDYYQILGIKRNASDAEIQKAYRTLARKYHPDVNPDDKAAKKKFQNIQKAYDVLKDPQKREMYDRYGSSFESMGAGPTGGAWRTRAAGGGTAFEDFDFSQVFGGHGGGAGGFESFGDFFQQFAGGGASRQSRTSRRRARGADVRHELEVPFQTAVMGGQAQLTLRRPSGKVETITVKIPAGVGDGKAIRLRGQGEEGAAGGGSGDLLITVRVAPHPCFERRGDDLQVVVPVTLAEAALGAKVDVPTPKGVIALKVPPGTSSGKRLRIKGHGVPRRNGEAGDLLALVQIVLPETLDEESKEFIRRLEKRCPQDPRAGLRW